MSLDLPAMTPKVYAMKAMMPEMIVADPATSLQRP